MAIQNNCHVIFPDRSKPNDNYAHHLLLQQESQHISYNIQQEYTLLPCPALRI